MGRVLQFSQYAKGAKNERIDDEKIQQARLLVQSAAGLLEDLGDNGRRVAWLLEDCLNLLNRKEEYSFLQDISCSQS